jgi:streptomycin 6-kinase
VDAALRDLARRWQRYWPEADSRALVADVEARFEAACDAWGVTSPQLLTGGVVALTCAAGDRVLKVLPRLHPERAQMRGEGETLAFWRPTGAAAELLDRRDDGMTLLLPRIEPATALDEAVPDHDEQLTVVGRLVRQLHAAGEPPSSVPPIAQHVAAFRRVSDPTLQAELDALLAQPGRVVAAHADLHGGNVLRDGDRWVAIDPKGVRGDPHLDIWLLACPQAPPLPDGDAAARAEAWRRVNLYADAAGLDAERAAAWVRVVAGAEAVLSADSAFGGWPQRLRRLAQALG